MSQISLIGFLLMTPFLLSNSEPCIREGTTQDISYPRPALDNPEMPTTAKWAGKNGTGFPHAKEHDSTSGHESMGWANGGDPAIVPVENKSGVLSGPNGKQLNGFPEGKCIEVIVCWVYLYKVRITKKGGSDYGNSSNGWEETYEVWRCGTICSNEKDICPCAKNSDKQ